MTKVFYSCTITGVIVLFIRFIGAMLTGEIVHKSVAPSFTGTPLVEFLRKEKSMFPLQLCIVVAITYVLAPRLARFFYRIDAILAGLLHGELIALVILLAIVANRMTDWLIMPLRPAGYIGFTAEWHTAMWIATLVALHDGWRLLLRRE